MARHLAQALINYGFHQLRSDNCVFTIWKDTLTFAIVVCNVDDCIIASNSSVYGDEIRHDLLGLFPGTDLGQLNAFCGIQIHMPDEVDFISPVASAFMGSDGIATALSV